MHKIVDKCGLMHRLYDNINVVNDCWIFQGAKSTNGYAKIHIGNHKYEWVHRVSFFLNNGYSPKRPNEVCHKRHCTSKLCINPDHLYEGNRSSNMYDYYALNKNKRNKNIYRRKLANVRSLLDMGVPQKLVAKIYNVHRRTIWKWMRDLTIQEEGGA